jgi:hypothetical protein
MEKTKKSELSGEEEEEELDEDWYSLDQAPGKTD